MLNKTALVVDDSRTACQILRLMLEREDFQVDVLGTAEAAIGYLRDHRPGIIFMDHLMPGMDGFQAVKEIKGSPLTATIPIVMYTAKSGELYVGQAHALGAADILPKPPTRENLRAIFRRIDAPAQVAGTPESAPGSVQGGYVAPLSTGMPAALPADESAAAPEPLSAPGERGADGYPSLAPAFVIEDGDDVESAYRSRKRVSWWPALAAGIVFFALGMAFSSRGLPEGAYLRTLAWELGEGFGYPHGEAPFSGERAERIRSLVEHLAEDGFRGTVRLEGNAGQFCLVSAPGGWRVADAALPIESCEMIGESAQEARQTSGRQSADFREFLEQSPLLARADIRVEVEALGDSKPRRPYPSHDQVASAGDWNRIAAENNRIAVILLPEP